MISYTNERYNGDRYVTKHTKTVSDALHSLIKFEIGYGGTIQDITRERVVIKTEVMAAVDTVTFEGTEEEMALLVEAAGFAIMANPFGDQAPEAYKDKVVGDVMAFTKGLPLLVRMGSGIIMGNTVSKVVLLSMIGSQEHAEHLSSIRNDDLFAIMMLVRQDKVSIDDALMLMAA